MEARTEATAQVYTDEARAYYGLNRPHEAVKHSAKEYVHGMAHTNGMESHWAMLKWGYVGVYHQMSVKHLPRYVAEFEGRHNSRPMDTAEQKQYYADGIGPYLMLPEDAVDFEALGVEDLCKTCKGAS